MKFTRLTVGCLILSGLACAASAADATKLPFDLYDGYFVSNQFEPDAAESFVVIDGQKQFDETFGAGVVMGDRAHRLPKDAFQSNLVIAAIKRGPALWTFTIQNVSLNDGVVELRYAVTSKPSDSSTFACPLIVSIPKGRYQAVRFIENRKTVKEVMLK